MVYKLTAKAENKEALPGAPAFGELTDEEFEAGDIAYSEAHQYPAHALRDSGFWEHADDPPAARSTKKGDD